jgi:hypothetical protein
MRKVIFSVILSFALVSGLLFANDIADLCNSSEIKEACKKELNPFDFDAFKLSRFNVNSAKERTKEMEVILFRGEKYRFIFNSESMAAPVKIEVYDKPSDKPKNRTLLFSSENFPKNQTQFVYEPDKSRKTYVVYTVTPDENTEHHKGCVAMMLGYEIKFKK